MAQPPEAKVSPQRRITHEALTENFAAGAVQQTFLIETKPRVYQIEVEVGWKPGRMLLTGTRGLPRDFKTLDTAIKELRRVANGKPLVCRLELLP